METALVKSGEYILVDEDRNSQERTDRPEVSCDASNVKNFRVQDTGLETYIARYSWDSQKNNLMPKALQKQHGMSRHA